MERKKIEFWVMKFLCDWSEAYDKEDVKDKFISAVSSLISEAEGEALRGYFRGSEIDSLIGEIEGAIEMTHTHEDFYNDLLKKLKYLSKIKEKGK